MSHQQSQGLRCSKCNTAFRNEVESGIPLTEWAEKMMALACPECGSNKLLFGMGLDLPEDRARRKGSSLEERIDNWLTDGDVGLSSKALLRYMHHDKKPDAYPHDWGDLLRVILLIDRIPEWRPRMEEMSQFEGWEEIGKRYEEILEAALNADPTLRSPTGATEILKTIYHR